jgi:hypothetical protein
MVAWKYLEIFHTQHKEPYLIAVDRYYMYKARNQIYYLTMPTMTTV